MWEDILGHEEQKKFLAQYLAAQERPHALLFLGPAGLGKGLLARAFAKSLLCFGHTGTDHCEACRLMNLWNGNLSHPDFLLVQREVDEKTGRRKDISIDQIKELIGKSAFAPTMGDTKVCIVEDIDRMSVAAANSFLKLLEEPPAGWVLLLLAENEEKLLATILSRVVRVRFQGIAPGLVQQALVEHGIAAERAAVLARVSEGSIGLALQLPELKFFEWREQAVALLEALPLATPLNYLAGRSWQQQNLDRSEMIVFVKALQLLLRDLLMCKMGQRQTVYNVDLADALEQQSGTWSVAALKQALGSVQQAYAALEASTGMRAVLENMALEIDAAYKKG